MKRMQMVMRQGEKKQRERRLAKKYVVRRFFKRTAVAATTFILATQPCFSFSTLAYTGAYEDERRLTEMVETYSDGTKRVYENKYDENGNLIYSSISNPDGSKSILKKSYNGSNCILENKYWMDDEAEVIENMEYSGNGKPVHFSSIVTYPDGTSESQEVWYHDLNVPVKKIKIDTDGEREQTDYVYDGQGNLLEVNYFSSGGNTNQEAWQYDEYGNQIYYKLSSYNASNQVTRTEETLYGGQQFDSPIYTLETTVYSEGNMARKEIWRREEDNQIIKTVATDSDGYQTTEEYLYDLDGKEILYKKINGNGLVETRETTTSENRKEIVYSDNKGNKTRISSEYDIENCRKIEESMENKEDGSTSYQRLVYRDEYELETYIVCDKTADGLETYIEATYNPDKSSIRKVKREDGTISETITDAQGYDISEKETKPDGSYSNTSWERSEDGKVVRMATKHSDGTVSWRESEYDVNGNWIKVKEMRKNGVYAVKEKRIDDTEKGTGTVTLIFNNGCQVIESFEEIAEDTFQNSILYSGGDVAQDILVEKEKENAYYKRIYRDGRTEEVSIDLKKESQMARDERYNLILEHYAAFIEASWNILPSQIQAASN